MPRSSRPLRVAIPFSSGLCSFYSTRRHHVQAILSQSLFHQVCVRSPPESLMLIWGYSRNPFFIRSVFVLRTGKIPQPPHRVAIPFSSGLCSFEDDVLHSHSMEWSQSLFHQVCVRSRLAGIKTTPVSWSQSLFHQVCVRSYRRFHTYMRNWKSQSLFHQVCVRSAWVRDKKGRKYLVAIPFSSGLCSFACQGSISSSSLTSQSLFHQVCVRSRLANCSVAGFQCRNPFFIRSVFVHATAVAK